MDTIGAIVSNGSWLLHQNNLFPWSFDIGDAFPQRNYNQTQKKISDGALPVLRGLLNGKTILTDSITLSSHRKPRSAFNSQTRHDWAEIHNVLVG
jgi:hypothetical protein